MAKVQAFSLATNGSQVHLAPELKLIVDLVDEGSRVLDLGCGRGDLLLALEALKHVRGEGIELDEECIQACVARGLANVYHGDLDEGLAGYGDKSMDFVILTDTIQVLHRPAILIREMARIGRHCIISLPNLAHWSARLQLALGGRMPRTARLPYEWYDTPNIHLTTIADFRAYCRQAGLKVLREIALRGTGEGRCSTVRVWPNLRADAAVFVVAEEG